MREIIDSESDSIADLSSFLDAELAYYDKCREVLLELKNSWPSRAQASRGPRHQGRSRSNTANSLAGRYIGVDEETAVTRDLRPVVRASTSFPYARAESPAAGYEENSRKRPNMPRSSTFEGPARFQRDASPVAPPRLSRIPSDSLTVRTGKAHFRPVGSTAPPEDIFHDQDDPSSHSNSSPDQSYGEISVSPATSQGSVTYPNNVAPTSVATKKAPPPPPPPSRAKKPPPPPPPAKRSVIV